MANTRSIAGTQKTIDALKARRARAEKVLADTVAPLKEAERYLEWLKAEPTAPAPAGGGDD